MNHTRHGVPLTVALALTAAGTTAALAQDDAPGLVGRLSFAQTLELSDNPDFVADPDGSALISRTSLNFAVESVTRTETFRANLGTLIEGNLTDDGPNDDFEFTSKTAALDYIREGASARLSLGATYVETDIDDLVFELADDTLVFDSGYVKRTTLTARLETGIDAPVGLTLSARRSDTDYVDTLDPDLVDTTRTAVDAVARFRINPALTARALAGFSRVDEDDGDETTRSYVGVGLAGDVRPGLSFSTDVLYDRVETDPAGTTEDGIGVDMSITQDLPRGSIGADLSSRVNDSGRVTRASIRRALDFKGGNISFALGVLVPDDAGVRPVASLNLTQETRRGQLAASLSQTPTTDDGDTILNTALAVTYEEAINSVSGWSAGITYAESNRLGVDDDASRTTATVTYTHDLTEDWDLSAGYSYSLRTEDGSEDRSENALFLSLQRDFSFGF